VSNAQATGSGRESTLGPEIGITGLRSQEIDAVKGILILCIAFGHRALLSARIAATAPFLYAFHPAAGPVGV
jgi:hypothetical protein